MKLLELFESNTGKFGEYEGDTSEKTMIHWIITYCIDKGGKTDENYDLAYSFLESDLGEKLHDKYYETFGQLHPHFVGPKRKNELNQFIRESRAWYKKWFNKKIIEDNLKKKQIKIDRNKPK